MKSVMLTGATGFIGSHIAEELIEKDFSLSLFTRKKNSLINSLERLGAQVFLGQSDDLKTLGDSIKGVDTVIHCAGATRALTKRGYESSNVEFTRNILKVLGKGQRFIFVSSQAAAGPSHSLVPSVEEDAPGPLTHYGRSKLQAEKLIKEWGEQSENKFTILRPCVVYGPREKDVYHYFKSVKMGFLFLLGNGGPVISIIHVRDLVSAILTAAGHKCEGKTFFVSGDKGHSWEEIGILLKNNFKKRYVIKLRLPIRAAYPLAYFLHFFGLIIRKPTLIDSQKITEMKQPEWLCSNHKIKNEMGWKPEITLEEGLSQTADWYTRHGWI